MLAVLFPHLLFTPLTGKESHIKMTEIAMHVTPDWITRTLGSLLAHVVLALGLTLLTTQALHSGAKWAIMAAADRLCRLKREEHPLICMRGCDGLLWTCLEFPANWNSLFKDKQEGGLGFYFKWAVWLGNFTVRAQTRGKLVGRPSEAFWVYQISKLLWLVSSWPPKSHAVKGGTFLEVVESRVSDAGIKVMWLLNQSIDSCDITLILVA